MMDHKAFLFDWSAFEAELLPPIETALTLDDASGLVQFITANLTVLRDPYEGEPLAIGWHNLLSTGDVQQCADFALTKYYDPTADIGLGESWITLHELIGREIAAPISPLLGRTIGPKGHPFDPGRMGSYFQDPQDVRRSRGAIESLPPIRGIDKAIRMLDAAIVGRRGLYITF
jgi:hypothetical protein